MADMYKDIVNGVSETVEIDGYPFYGENIRGNNPYNRRELNRQKLLGGTENVTRGKYISREYTFSTDVYTEGNPRVFDEIFMEMSNKPCEVISPYMGGKFKAEVIFDREDEEASPEHVRLEVTVKEIPEQQPNIPGESFTIPEDVLETENKKATDAEKESNVTETKTNDKIEQLKAKWGISVKSGEKIQSKSKTQIVNELQSKLKKRS